MKMSLKAYICDFALLIISSRCANGQSAGVQPCGGGLKFSVTNQGRNSKLTPVSMSQKLTFLNRYAIGRTTSNAIPPPQWCPTAPRFPLTTTPATTHSITPWRATSQARDSCSCSFVSGTRGPRLCELAPNYHRQPRQEITQPRPAFLPSVQNF